LRSSCHSLAVYIVGNDPLWIFPGRISVKSILEELKR
jgi:hypothetical protein